MIEEEELTIPEEQESVDHFVKEFTLSYMKSDITMQMKRLRYKANAMSRKEYEEKENMLKATLLNIDNDDLEGITFDKMKEFEEKLGLLPVDEETRRHGMEATYQERIKAFEENIEEKNKKAEDFVRKMSAERREINHKKKDEKRKEREKLKAELEKKREREEIEKAKKTEMRRNLEDEIKERMKEHERNRQEMKEKWERDKLEISKKKYKHQELEERYQRKVVIPSLERKKEELKKKREFFAPISHQELVDHEREYTKRLKMKLREKKQKREKWYKDIGYGDYDPNKYQSKYLSSAENENLEPKIDEIEIIHYKCDKQRNYAKFVKEMHRPKVSVKKKKEMKAIIKQIENSGMSRQLEISKAKMLEIQQKELKKNEKLQYENYIGIRQRGGSHSAIKSVKRQWNKYNSMIPKPKLQRKGYVVDYLLKKRIQRDQMHLDDPDNDTQKINWGKYGGTSVKHARSYSNAYEDNHNIMPHSRFDHEIQKSEDEIIKQRLDLIKNKAKQIEEAALEKEKNMKLTTGTNVKDSNVINNLLINSIEAKLHLLKDI